MRTLRPREDRRFAARRGGGWREADLEALVAHELDAGASMDSAAGVAPEQGCGTYLQRMQKETDLARLGGRVALPLTKLSQWARAAVANAGRIDHAQAAISLATPLVGVKRLPCRAAERAVGLERKV